MKIFIWKEAHKVSNFFHDDGGLLIVAKDEARAKEIIEAHELVIVTEKNWENVIVIEAKENEKERLITFPDAGCCM